MVYKNIYKLEVVKLYIESLITVHIYPRANGAKRCSGRKLRARVTNFAQQ